MAAWPIDERIHWLLSIMTIALSHVTKHIKLPTLALLACALRGCIKLKDLTLPMNLACPMKIIQTISQQMCIYNVSHCIKMNVEVNQQEVSMNHCYTYAHVMTVNTSCMIEEVQSTLTLAH